MAIEEFLLVSLLLLRHLVSSQPFFNASTVPMGIEGANPLVAATEGTNVNLTCEVFRISDGIQRQTMWTLIRDGEDEVIVRFLNGMGQENFENFVVVEPERAQLTILDFNSSFDKVQIGCGSGSEITARFDLRIIKAPSKPRNLIVLVIGAEFVNISWINPTNIGTPTFTCFRLKAVSTVNTVNVSITATNTVDEDFVNMYTVTGLKPNTEYNITVRALSTVEQLISEPSESIVFNTTIGAPSISRALLNNVNGNLSVLWEFLHTGGSGLETVIVQCSEKGDEETVDDASANYLAVALYCSATVDCVMGSVSVGPVIAGGNYSCLVTAENNIGSDKMRTDYIIVTTGIPSVPEIISVSGGAGFATITLRVDNFGVLVATDFTFIVSVFSQSDTSNPVVMTMITPDSVDTPMVTIVVDLSEGTYVFSVVSSNSLGPPSGPSSMSGSAVVQQRPSTTTIVSTIATPTTTTTTSSTSSTGVGTEPTGSSSALPGGAIAGIVIAIIILIAIIAIVVFIIFYVMYQNRGNKVVKDSLSNRNLSFLPSANYEIIDKPDHLQNNYRCGTEHSIW